MAERYVSKGFSFLLGWLYWYNWTIILPAELRFVSARGPPSRFYLFRSPRSAAAILIGYWDSKTSPAVWITVCMIVVILINMLGAGMYSASDKRGLSGCLPRGTRCLWRGRICLRVREHASSRAFNLLTHTDDLLHRSSIKVFAIVGLIILGIIIDLGGGPNHDRQGDFALDRILRTLTFVSESDSVTGKTPARSFSTMAFLEPQVGLSDGGASFPKPLSLSLERRSSP